MALFQRDTKTQPEIKTIRLALGMSQAEFARALGRSYNSIQNYETGRQVPAKVLERARALAHVPGRLLRAKSIIEQAAQILLEEAVEGNDYAEEQLRRYAAEMQERAGHAVRLADRKQRTEPEEPKV